MTPPRLPPVGDPRERVWVFDLDNTLYPPSCDLFAQVDRNMQAFIADFLKVDQAEARRVQKQYYREHGTTLRGLMIEHGMDPAEYLAFVHQIDLSVMPANPALDAALGRLEGRKLIYTNGSARHAANVLDRLAIARHFDGVHDIVAADYVPKPDAGAFQAMLAAHGVDARRATMFEDLPRNLVPAHALGMTTVLVRGTHELTEIDADGAHIHHVTDDLAAWLDLAVLTQGERLG